MNKFIILLCGVLFIISAHAAPTTVKFKKRQISINGKTLLVEVAQSFREQQRGLMERMHLKPNGGMLFIYDKEQILKFWMKNTYIPLSIGFFNSNKELIDIQDMTPVKSVMQAEIPQYKSRAPASFALEVNQGWFKKNNIRKGSHFKFIDKTEAKSPK